MNRRRFLELLGIGTAAVAAGALPTSNPPMHRKRGKRGTRTRREALEARREALEIHVQELEKAFMFGGSVKYDPSMVQSWTQVFQGSIDAAAIHPR